MTTESDRELLELAAKAAGMDGATYQEPESWFETRYGMSQAIYHKSTGYWNPLEDDGDALRLAVKLRIDLSLWLYKNSVEAKTYIGAGKGISLVSDNPRQTNSHREGYGTDPYAATRRAIVRAAAAIGAHKEGD